MNDDKSIPDTTAPQTKSGAEAKALPTPFRLQCQAKFRQLRGKLNWQGDLNAMRLDR